MKKRTIGQRQKDLKALAEIPELTEEQLGRAVRGQMYRPIKKPVTMRLDADVIAWLKEDGRGYQTKANALLRKEMLRSYEQKRGPEREGAESRSKRARSR